MELTKYKINKGVFWIDLYGNPYKKCCKCGDIKGG